MSVVSDIEKLAQLLLKDKKIDQEGFSFIASNFSKLNKTKSSRKKNGKNNGQSARKAGLRPNEAIDFIAGLKVKLIGAKNRTVSEEEIMKSVAKYYKLRYKKLDPLDLNIDIVTNTIPKPFALNHMILPLYEANGVLHIAIIDPEDRENIDAISRVTGKKVNPIISTPGEIERIINEFFGFHTSVSKAEVELSGSGVDIGNLEQLNRIARPDQLHSNDEHIKNAVDYLFTTAFEMRASDIHIEPKRDLSLVRFRIDGILGDLYSVPKGVHQAIASRIKMLSRMDIAEKRHPQDGRIRLGDRRLWRRSPGFHHANGFWRKAGNANVKARRAFDKPGKPWVFPGRPDQTRKLHQQTARNRTCNRTNGKRKNIDSLLGARLPFFVGKKHHNN